MALESYPNMKRVAITLRESRQSADRTRLGGLPV